MQVSYWDSCLFIDFLNGSPAGQQIVSPLIAAARNGELTIVTSTLSLAEVAYVARELTDGLDVKVENAIETMFRDNELLTLVEYDEDIGVESRKLIRRTLSMDRRLKPADAIHLATAAAVSADVLFTFDSALIGHAQSLHVTNAREPEPLEMQP